MATSAVAAGIPDGYELDTGAPAAPPAAAPADLPPGYELDTSAAADAYKGTTSGVIKGTAGLPTVPGNVVSLTQKPFDWALNKAGEAIEAAHPGWGQYVPSQENIEKYYAEHPELTPPPGFRGRPNALTEAGSSGSRAVTDVLDPASAAIGGGTSTYQPTTGYGRFGQTAGAFAPNLLLGPMSAEGLVGRGLTQVLAPAAGAEAGAALGPAVGVSPDTGRIGGAILGGGLAGAALPSVTPELAGAAETLGTQLPAAATGGPLTRAAGWLAQKVPIAGAPLTAMANRARGQATTAVKSALSDVGAADPATAGQIFKDAYSDWHTAELNPQTTTMWDNVSQATDQAVQSPLDNTARWAAQTQVDRMRSGLPSSPAVDDLTDALAKPGMSFDDMKRLRTTIGAKISPQVTPVGTNAAEYDQAYKMLTEDMGQAALNGGGQPAYDLWQQAVQSYKTNLGRQEAVAKIIGLDGSAPPEQVVAQLQKMAGTQTGADIGSLTKARGTIGDAAWQRLAGSVAQNMGRDPATGDLSLAVLAKNYAGLSDAGKQALFPAGTPLRTTLDAIGPVTQSLKGFGGGYLGHGAVGVGGALIIEHLLDNPITALKIGAPMLPVGALLSMPATASSFAKYLGAYRAATGAGQLGQAGIGAMKNLQGATRNLANTANSVLGANMDPSRVLQALPLGIGGNDQGQQQ